MHWGLHYHIWYIFPHKPFHKHPSIHSCMHPSRAHSREHPWSDASRFTTKLNGPRERRVYDHFIPVNLPSTGGVLFPEPLQGSTGWVFIDAVIVLSLFCGPLAHFRLGTLLWHSSITRCFHPSNDCSLPWLGVLLLIAPFSINSRHCIVGKFQEGECIWDVEPRCLSSIITPRSKALRWSIFPALEFCWMVTEPLDYILSCGRMTHCSANHAVCVNKQLYINAKVA